MKTTVVKYPKPGDIVCDAIENTSCILDIAVILMFDKKELKAIELLPTGLVQTYWVGLDYEFTILCPSEK